MKSIVTFFLNNVKTHQLSLALTCKVTFPNYHFHEISKNFVQVFRFLLSKSFGYYLIYNASGNHFADTIKT